MKKIDPRTVKIPKVEVSASALSQINLALSNDPYLGDKYFRIHISGKGCDGFSYDTFFDHQRDDDIILDVQDGELEIIMSAFTAYYCSHIVLDYITEYENDIEGFRVMNKNQKLFKGKFWRGAPNLTPKIK